MRFWAANIKGATSDGKAAGTAVRVVRLRETSACMRLEEEEEAEDGTLLMLMRERSVSVINIGGRTDSRWSRWVSFESLSPCLVVFDAGRGHRCAFEARATEAFEEERDGLVSPLAWPACE